MSDITAKEKSVQSILSEKYTVDFYQREYKWEEKHVVELVRDLVDAFILSWKPEYEDAKPDPKVVGDFRAYFLGSIIVSDRAGDCCIVDGQQRLTTLNLIIIALIDKVDEVQKGQLKDIIYSVKHREMKFNLDIEERQECLAALCEGGSFDEERRPESVRKILQQYQVIERELNEIRMGEENAPFPFPYFSDWLIDRVHLVEIKATSAEDAYAIFEAMNDRGLSLTPTEMLKGYLLAKIPDSAARDEAESIWKERVGALVDYGKDEDSGAIKAWLRGRYARDIRDRQKNAIPKDFDRIGSEFHRWVRNNEEYLNLKNEDDFKRIIVKEFKFYSRWYLHLRRAADDLSNASKDGLENVYHNAESKFTLQYPVLLSALSPDDSDAIAIPKLQVVAAYLDILIHRRIWNGQTISYSGMNYAMFLLMRELRDCKDARAIVKCLVDRLANPSMSAGSFSKKPHFCLNPKRNKPQVRRILARITAMLEQWAADISDYAQHYKEYAKYEIEHIWADKYNEHSHNAEFESKESFQEFRNRIGGLLLLHKSDNASYNDKPYSGSDGKLNFYYGQNLLAKSLHEKCYDNNPKFLRLINERNLPFMPHPEFKKSDLEKRQALYLQIAEQIWNPDHLLELVKE